MTRVGLYTLGCKVSQYETEAVAEAFEKAGATVSDFDGVNDVYVINTCTVTAESDRKCRQFVRRAVKKNPDAIVAVLGCYSQRSPDELAKIDGVDVIIGTQNKLSSVKICLDMLEKKRHGEPISKQISVTDVSIADFEPMTVTRAPRARAYVKIEDGCESKCTYCAISAARGRVRSKLPGDVISEVEALSATGVKEIVLTGIETGSYGKDFADKYTLADLICELDRRESCKRLRLGSLAPELIGADFVEKVRNAKILAPHFHLSIQSGSDNVLHRMKRRYTRARALENIERLKAAFPTAAFTTDMMVGFPGETEDDFLQSVDFATRVGFIDMHVFTYSRREGTAAADYPDQIAEDVKHSRSERLIRLKEQLRERVLSDMVSRGTPVSAVAETRLADGSYTAHSDNFAEIRFSADKCTQDLRGEIVIVAPVSHKDGILFATLVNSECK